MNCKHVIQNRIYFTATFGSEAIFFAAVGFLVSGSVPGGRSATLKSIVQYHINGYVY